MNKKVNDLIKIILLIDNNSKDSINLELPKTQKLDKLSALICLMYNYDLKTIIITHESISLDDYKFKNLTLEKLALKNKNNVKEVELCLEDKEKFNCI